MTGYPKPVLIPTDNPKVILDGWECSDGKQFVGQEGEKLAGKHEAKLQVVYQGKDAM